MTEDCIGIKDLGHPEIKKIVSDLFSGELSGPKARKLSLIQIKGLIIQKLPYTTSTSYLIFKNKISIIKEKEELLSYLADYLLGEVL